MPFSIFFLAVLSFGTQIVDHLDAKMDLRTLPNISVHSISLEREEDFTVIVIGSFRLVVEGGDWTVREAFAGHITVKMEKYARN